MTIYTIGKAVPKYIGASTDTKPTAAAPQSQLEPQIGSTFFERDTNTLWITYDRTSWVLKDSIGEVKAAPTTYTLLDRVKALLTGTILAAGTARIGTVSGVLKEVRVAKAIDASIGAYSANDVVNDDDCSTTATHWTFSAVARANGEHGVIYGATIFSETVNIAPRLTLYLFNAAPTGEKTDNSANTNPLPADRAKYIGKIDFPALEALGTGAASTAVVTPSTVGNLPLPFKCVTVDDIYGVLVTRDIFTQVATEDIEITLLIEQY